MQDAQNANDGGEAATVVHIGDMSGLLFDVGRRLDQLDTVESLAECVVREVAEALGAHGCALAVASAGTAEVIATTGYRADRVAAYDGLSLESVLPLTDAMRKGLPVWISTRADLDRRYPLLAASPNAHSSAGIVPFAASGGPSGALAVSYLVDRELDEGARLFLIAVSQLCGLALRRIAVAAVPWSRLLDLVAPYEEVVVFDPYGVELFASEGFDALSGLVDVDHGALRGLIRRVIASGRTQRVMLGYGQDGAEQLPVVALPIPGDDDALAAVVVRPDRRR